MATNTTARHLPLPAEARAFGSHLVDERPARASTPSTSSARCSTRSIVAVRVTVLVLFFDSLAAFAFAKFDFPGRERPVRGCCMVIFMLPAQLAVIPQFVIMVEARLGRHAEGADRPGRGQRVRHLLDAPVHPQRACPTNCSTPPGSTAPASSGSTGTSRCPLIRPGLAFLGIYTFIASWNDYIWPLVVLTNPDQITLQVALAQLNRVHNLDYAMVMAGALLAVIPLVVVFALFARNFVGDLAKGAVRE